MGHALGNMLHAYRLTWMMDAWVVKKRPFEVWEEFTDSFLYVAMIGWSCGALADALFLPSIETKLFGDVIARRGETAQQH
jgi:hypothetical protein